MRITANKTVYWSDGFKEMSGKVKQIFQDHALVQASSSNYIVAIKSLSLKPTCKLASSRVIISSGGQDG